MLEAIRFSSQSGNVSLSILNQLKLPHQTEYIDITSCEDAFDAILSMKVRGAPAIAIVAALSLAVELNREDEKPVVSSAAEKAAEISRRLEYLVSSRPTAVNLGRAARDLSALVNSMATSSDGQVSAQEVVRVYSSAAEKMLEDDIADNWAIGKNGAEWIIAESVSGQVQVLTHCNTGSLATAGYGTALGIIRHLHHQSKALKHAFCTETRPYNQGARLTAYELMTEQMPATLITDSMAGALMNGSRTDTPHIDAIIVGADRVAANGDTANKIGTYSLAVLAKHHPKTKFIVAAPWTTIDLETETGKDIVIEQRKAVEVTTLTGPIATSDSKTTDIVTIKLAAPGIGVWNPSFDITPAKLIDAIITERGVIERGSDGKFDLAKLAHMARVN